MQYRVATAAGAWLAYSDTGPEHYPAHVFIAGLGSAGSVVFAPVLAHPGLAGRARHLVVDLIGSGWSDHDDTFGHTIEEHADTVGALLDDLAVRDVTLIGHSLGGSVAITLATRRPDLVAHLVVIEPNLDPGVGTFSSYIVATDEDTFAVTGHRTLVRGLRRLAAGGDAGAAESALTVARWSPRGLHRSAVSLLAERPRTFRDQLTTLTCPRRYLSGARTGEHLNPLREIGCDVRVVPDAAHVVMSDNLDGFVAALDGLPRHDRWPADAPSS